MIFTYRTKISGSQKILADHEYSFTFSIYSPDFSEELLKAGLDALLATLRDKFPLKTIAYVLWEKPTYPSVEIPFVFRETSGAGEDLNWFSDQIEELAREGYYLDFYLLETAIFLPAFPWWVLFLGLSIGAWGVKSAIKKKAKT